MKKIFSILLIFSAGILFAQQAQPVIKVSVSLQSLLNGNDTLTFAPAITQIIADPLSNITEVRKANQTRYGFRFEILKSRIFDEDSYVIRYAIYEKQNDTDDWRRIFEATNDSPLIESRKAKISFNQDHKDFHYSFSIDKFSLRYDIAYQWEK